jgi:membrane fusion protein, multidrug efflux system
VTVPPVAVQRGPDGLYVWVIKPDKTVEQRPVDVQTVNDKTAIVSKGLKIGEKIVVEGQSRLDDGTHVNVRPAGGAPREPG